MKAMNRLLTAIFAAAFMSLIFSSAAMADWEAIFDFSDWDKPNSVIQTTDGGYVITGFTGGYPAGFSDNIIWLIKVDADGGEQWNKAIGPAYSFGNSIQQTPDGGYIIAGKIGPGATDQALLIKIDSDGNEQWRQTYGEVWDNEAANSVRQTADGGYIIVGKQAFAPSYVDDSLLLIKTDSSGNKQWDRLIGGAKDDTGRSVLQMGDGGYLIGGTTESYGHGASDFWLIRTDADGNVRWHRTFGGPGSEVCRNVQRTSDGGYILSGDTTSYGAGETDIWLVKIAADGTEQWDRAYGGPMDETGSAMPTSDGGYIIVGNTQSYGDHYYGLWSPWLVKTGADGAVEWSQVLASDGTLFGGGAYGQQTDDGGYIIASDAVIESGTGVIDIWLKKIDDTACTTYFADRDGDGYGDSSDSMCVLTPYLPFTAPTGGDCDDNDPGRYPGNQEVFCNDIDDDCDPATPDDPNADGDPVTFCEGDCDDNDPAVYPGAVEVMCNGKDDDCNAATPDDMNADGDPVSLCDGDCDDNDPGRYPGNQEVFCNDIDDDCSAATPDDMNADGDPVSLCEGDCDDNDPDIYPGNQEVFCNDIDDDCNAATPDDPNADGDPVSLCEGDCDDNDPGRYPGNPEICGDGIDNDCDDLIDSDDPDCPGLTTIDCLSPSNESLLSSAPTFSWTATGGTDNRFAVDLSYDWAFSWYWSTFKNMRRPIDAESWAMPPAMWNYIPSGRYVYWRVRGADLGATPLTIITGDDVWWFYKY